MVWLDTDVGFCDSGVLVETWWAELRGVEGVSTLEGSASEMVAWGESVVGEDDADVGCVAVVLSGIEFDCGVGKAELSAVLGALSVALLGTTVTGGGG